VGRGENLLFPGFSERINIAWSFENHDAGCVMIRTREIDALVLPFVYLFTCCPLPCQWSKSSQSSVPLDPMMTQPQAIIQGWGRTHSFEYLHAHRILCEEIGSHHSCFLFPGFHWQLLSHDRDNRLRRLHFHQTLSRTPLDETNWARGRFVLVIFA